MKLVKLFSLIIFFLVVTNVVVANTAVDESVAVKSINAEIASLSNQNIVLRQQIAALGSLSNIQSKVEAMGFVESPQIVSLKSSSVALR
ncbi:MAG: hypothetical protein Fur0011_5570 [Candidatus Microgenomates bacterium]